MFHEDLAVEYKILGITSGHGHLQRKQQEVWIRSGGASSMIFPYLRGFVSMQRLLMRVGRNDEDFIWAFRGVSIRASQRVGFWVWTLLAYKCHVGQSFRMIWWRDLRRIRCIHEFGHGMRLWNSHCVVHKQIGKWTYHQITCHWVWRKLKKNWPMQRLESKWHVCKLKLCWRWRKQLLWRSWFCKTN